MIEVFTCAKHTLVVNAPHTVYSFDSEIGPYICPCCSKYFPLYRNFSIVSQRLYNDLANILIYEVS